MSPILRLFALNWKLKILAFTLAIFLWVVVSAEEVTSRWIDTPLQVRVTDPEYMLNGETVPREVSVRFSGPRRELIDLRFRRPPLVLNVLDVDDVQQTFELDTRMVQLPPQLSVSVVDIQPAALTLDFTRVETRSFTVHVRLATPLPDDWTIAEGPVVEPARVRVSGTEAELAGLDSIFTVPVEFALADTTFSFTAPLDTTELAGLRLSARRVQITGRLDRVVERTFSGIPIAVGPGILIQPATTEVTLQGPDRAIATITPDQLRVVISIDSIPSQITGDGLRVPLRIDGLPPEVQTSLSPGTVLMRPARFPARDEDDLPGEAVEPADTLPDDEVAMRNRLPGALRAAQPRR